MNFKEWITISERTLYHGTVVDNEESIRKYGLQGGWQGPLGSFVSKFYDDEEHGEPTEDDEVVFASDRNSLGKSVTAMVHHIAQKLGKNFHSVTDNDIRNHGLLVMIKDSDLKPYSAHDRSWAHSVPPRGVEEGDYFDNMMSGDVYLRGAALLRFLKRNGQWPRNWGVDSGGRSDALRGRLGAIAISRGHEKSDALEKISKAPLSVVSDQLKKWI